MLTTLTMQNVAANRSAWATRRQAASGTTPAAAAEGSATSADAAVASSGSSPADAAAARYFAGSWDALPGLLTDLGLQHSYDLLLTAETIYRWGLHGNAWNNSECRAVTMATVHPAFCQALYHSLSRHSSSPPYGFPALQPGGDAQPVPCH